MYLTSNQLGILDHTVHRASCGFFNGDSDDMQELVRLGLMRCVGSVDYVPEPYFAITQAGREALAQHRPKSAPQFKTRSQERYDRFLREDSGLTFSEWLKIRAREA